MQPLESAERPPMVSQTATCLLKASPERRHANRSRSLRVMLASLAEAAIIQGGVALVSLIIFGVFLIVAAGQNPVSVYADMWKGSYGTRFSQSASLAFGWREFIHRYAQRDAGAAIGTGWSEILGTEFAPT